MRLHCKDVPDDTVYIVYVDGVEEKYCVEFDTDVGWASYRPVNSEGNLDSDEIKMKYGKITFKVKKRGNYETIK